MINESNIALLIESSIKKGNADIISFFKTLISQLKKIIPINFLKYIIKKRLYEKQIYFIRHAEAEHNVLERKFGKDFEKINVYDPNLTDKGVNQTLLTIQKLRRLTNRGVVFNSVFISPLKRTFQTYFLIYKNLNRNTQVFATDFAREVLSGLDKNKGQPLSWLKNELKEEKINLDFMTKEYWWYDDGKNKENENEGSLRFQIRLRLFILWLIFRPENNILIISHSHVFNGLQDKGIVNADLAKMDNNVLYTKIEELLTVTIPENIPAKKPVQKAVKKPGKKVKKK